MASRVPACKGYAKLQELLPCGKIKAMAFIVYYLLLIQKQFTIGNVA